MKNISENEAGCEEIFAESFLYILLDVAKVSEDERVLSNVLICLYNGICKLNLIKKEMLLMNIHTVLRDILGKVQTKDRILILNIMI